MAKITERDLAPYKPKPDVWDRVVRSPDNKKSESTNLTEAQKIKDKVISFRVTEREYKKLMRAFGDPSGIRQVLIRETKNNADLETIQINERGNLIDIG